MGGKLVAGNIGNGPGSIQHMYEADVVIMKKPRSHPDRLHIAKNRHTAIVGDAMYSTAIETTLYTKSLEQAIDIVAEVIAKKKFGGITQVFEEGMKIELVEAMKKIVNR